MVRSIEKTQKLLPSDLWVGLAFSVLQSNPIIGSRNIGYLFDANNLISSPKRKYSKFDDALLQNKYPSDLCYKFAEAWIKDAAILRDNNVPFSVLNAPNGMKIELRVCLDVVCGPFEYEPSFITLVPAYGLNLSRINALSSNRGLVIVNDAKSA